MIRPSLPRVSPIFATTDNEGGLSSVQEVQKRSAREQERDREKERVRSETQTQALSMKQHKVQVFLIVQHITSCLRLLREPGEKKEKKKKRKKPGFTGTFPFLK